MKQTIPQSDVKVFNLLKLRAWRLKNKLSLKSPQWTNSLKDLNNKSICKCRHHLNLNLKVVTHKDIQSSNRVEFWVLLINNRANLWCKLLKKKVLIKIIYSTQIFIRRLIKLAKVFPYHLVHSHFIQLEMHQLKLINNNTLLQMKLIIIIFKWSMDRQILKVQLWILSLHQCWKIHHRPMEIIHDE